MLKRVLVVVGVMGVMGVAVSVAVADDDSPTYLSPEEAGPDFAVQGEYVGRLDAGSGVERWGAQVIALGDGQFTLVGYEGGLPGDGWKRADRRERADGKTEGAVTRFAADDWTAEIRNQVLTVFDSHGTALGTLERVNRESPTLGAQPPEGAIVLFDGSSAEQFDGGAMTPEGWLKAACSSKRTLGDHKMHLEFRTPFKPFARGQDRGNSGVYVQSRYEIQILDSFGLEGENNECGGIYSIAKPAVNMCLPPLAWQTYDIDFTAARYEDGRKVRNARVTVLHNGVTIMDDLELPHDTPGRLAEGPDPAPVYLQGHGNPVVFRNIWVVEK